MVEYKKKKLILQSGGTRNYYYKVSSDGKKKQVSKSEYLEKKGGNNNWIAPPIISMNQIINEEKRKRAAEFNKIKYGTPESFKFLKGYQGEINNIYNKTRNRLLKEKEESKPEFFKEIDNLIAICKAIQKNSGLKNNNENFLKLIALLKYYSQNKYTNNILLFWDWDHKKAYDYAVDQQKGLSQNSINWYKFARDFLNAVY